MKKAFLMAIVMSIIAIGLAIEMISDNYLLIVFIVKPLALLVTALIVSYLVLAFVGKKKKVKRAAAIDAVRELFCKG